MNTTKKDRLKVFSVLAGIVLILLALSDVARFALDVIAPIFLSRYAQGFTLVTLVNPIPAVAELICFVTPAIIAAIILFIKKDSVAVFISLGLLTYTIFNAIFKFFSTILLVLGRAIITTPAAPVVNSFVSLVSLVLSLICAVILVVIFCIPAVTFLKKHRAILSFILTAVFVLGVVVLAGYLALRMISNLRMISVYAGTSLQMYAIYNGLISPVLYAIPRVVLFVPVLLASIGMISKSKKASDIQNADADSIAANNSAEPVAETIVECESNSDTAEENQ